MSTTTIVPLRRSSNSLNEYHTNAVAFDGIVGSTSTSQMEEIVTQTDDCYANHNGDGGRSKASFMTWRMCNPVQVARVHWIPCLLAVGVLFFTGVEEYMLQMIPASSEPFDIGFVATRSLYRLLASSPDLNTVLAALNTTGVCRDANDVYFMDMVGGRTTTSDHLGLLHVYLSWHSWLLYSAPSSSGSGVDFPVGNVSFFLFYSGHVAGSTIASLDMRRMKRLRLALLFDILNVLQSIRLLGTRGQYTIDLAVGVGAGVLFDSLAGKYEEMMSKRRNVGNGFSLISSR
ncbi:hypothetical protein Bca101_089425 [Brassica carinata]